MIADRLVYGCARLTGGPSAAASRRLVEACLAAGVRRFDTAPGYGVGTAERVLGNALAGRSDTRLTIKLGSSRPPLANLLTYARALKGAVRRRASPLRADFRPTASIGSASGLDVSVAAMARSLVLSRRALRRDRFDVVLLHEARPGDVGEEQIAFLDGLRSQGVADAVGWSTGAVADAAIAASMPGHFIAQAAVAPDLFQRPSGYAPAYLHTIANIALYQQRIDAAFARWSIARGNLIPDSVADRQTALIVVGFARLAAMYPDRGLIFASIDPARLARFLAAVQHLDRHVGPDPFMLPIE